MIFIIIFFIIICRIAAFNPRNNHISNQSPSKTAQNLARSFKNYILALSVTTLFGYFRDWSKSIGGGGGGPEQRGGGSSVFEPLVRGGSYNF